MEGLTLRTDTECNLGNFSFSTSLSHILFLLYCLVSVVCTHYNFTKKGNMKECLKFLMTHFWKCLDLSSSLSYSGSLFITCFICIFVDFLISTPNCYFSPFSPFWVTLNLFSNFVSLFCLFTWFMGLNSMISAIMVFVFFFFLTCFTRYDYNKVHVHHCS